uniref:BLM10_mid domain-containing protein n=1 Tax=Angiostrongylus cantonensis TaxID=6313 RepID=A0A158PC00_ANGCA
LQKPSFVVVDAGVNVERDKARKFGRHEKKFVLLPYHEQLSNYLDDYFKHIKHGLVISVLVNENRPALRNYILALRKFVEANGFRFSKGDHLKLIQLLYLVMVKKGQWHDVIHYAAKALEKLLNKCYFNHNDLVLEWEPAYDLYYGAAFGKLEDVESNRIRTAIFRLKRFYKPSDSAKIWKRVKVHLAPRYSNKEFCEMALLFLEVRMSTEAGVEVSVDFEKAAPTFCNYAYNCCSSIAFLQCFKSSDLTCADENVDTAGFLIVACSEEQFFSDVMDGVESVGSSRLNQFDDFVVCPSCLRDQVFYSELRCKLVYHNPDFMNWTPLYDIMFTHIIRAMGLCLRDGKIAVPKQFYLTDTDTKLFVEATMQSLLYSLYSKDGKNCHLPAKLLMMLGVLQPGLVLPRFLENVYPAIFAVCEPHRLTQTLDCMFELIYIIACNQDVSTEQRKTEKAMVKEIERCVKYYEDLTADEKSLCLMSARLPLLAELALDRMLEVIQTLSITSPKDSSSQLGSFKDEATKESEEEKVLKKGIDRCVAALFTNTAASITSVSFIDQDLKMAKKVFNFMKTNQFESQLATDMISSLISQMTYASPSFWLPFADHVLRNLRELLTPEWRKFSVEFQSGCNGLWYMLHMLSRIYPENSRYVAERLNRPLSEWVPIREWSKVYDFCETKMAWHVPNDKSKELVEALLTKFLFPTVESLKNKDMDRESLKKAIAILNYGFSGAATCFAMPSSAIFMSPNTILPWYNTNSVNPSTNELDIAVGEHNDIYAYLTTPISRKWQIFVLESQAYVAHMRNVVESPTTLFTSFHLKVFRVLARLTINDYSEVRSETLSVFAELFKEYSIARELIVDDILPVLTNPESTKEQLKVRQVKTLG